MGLRCCVRAFSCCGERGATLHCSAQASHYGGFSCCRARTVEHRLSSCGARALLLHGMWDLPGPGLEPVSPALAGGFLATAPPGKPNNICFAHESATWLGLGGDSPPRFYVLPLGVAQRQALTPGYWLRPYVWFISYCGPENTQVAPQMAWAFSHRVAGFQGSLQKELNPT